jgi:hypothetical protein
VELEAEWGGGEWGARGGGAGVGVAVVVVPEPLLPEGACISSSLLSAVMKGPPTSAALHRPGGGNPHKPQAAHNKFYLWPAAAHRQPAKGTEWEGKPRHLREW